MNPDKFYHRTKLFNDILYEIFNVESNYRTELSVLNLKLLRKIEGHKNTINKLKQEKLRQTISASKTFKNPTNLKLPLKTSKSDECIHIEREENPMIDKLMSESLQNLLIFYKIKHKLISKEVSNLGIIIYGFSSSQKKFDYRNDTSMIENYQKDFDISFAKLMKVKKKYFEKMNNLELLLHEEENNKKIKDPKKKENNQNKKNDEKEKIDELIELRQKYKKYLTTLTHTQKMYISKINEIGNDIQEFNITENNILYDIFKIFEENLISLLKEINNFCLLYQHNKKLIQDLNIELGNNLIFDERIYINYKFEEYVPKFTDIDNQKNMSVIEKMNKLIGFEFDKIKTNQSNNENLIDTIIYNKNIDDNLLFILLMDKFTGVETTLNEKEQNLMKNLFKQEKYIKEFLNKLNKIRINRSIFNKKEKFNILLDFFNEIYSKMSFFDEKYHELIKFLMILSETFNYIEGDKKIFINNVVNVPEEMKDIKFWIKYIELEVESEYKVYENKKNTRYEYIVLLSNTTHLKEYLFDKDKMNQIIEYFRDKYKLTNEEIDIIKEQLKI